MLLHTLAFVRVQQATYLEGTQASRIAIGDIPACLKLLWWLHQLKQYGIHTEYNRQAVHITMHLQSYLHSFISDKGTSISFIPMGTCAW